MTGDANQALQHAIEQYRKETGKFVAVVMSETAAGCDAFIRGDQSPRVQELLEANNAYLERARKAEALIVTRTEQKRIWQNGVEISLNSLAKTKARLREANERLNEINDPARGSFTFLEMEAALCVWEWMLDDGSDQIDGWRDAIGTVEARHASYEIGRYCIEIYELGKMVDGPDAWADAPYDWEVIPAICRTITFVADGRYHFLEGKDEAVLAALDSVKEFRELQTEKVGEPTEFEQSPFWTRFCENLQALAASFGAALDSTVPPPLSFRYLNYRGECSIRTVRPINVYFGSTEWHPEPQWLLAATDLEKNERRDFAIKDINPPFPTPVEVENLKNAIEGECDGLAITDDQAVAILKWIVWQQA